MVYIVNNVGMSVFILVKFIIWGDICVCVRVCIWFGMVWGEGMWRERREFGKLLGGDEMSCRCSWIWNVWV